jgi:hypothetical protein
MHTFMGIALDTWVSVDGDCPVECEVSTNQVQIELGHGTGSLHLVMTEQGLARLAGAAGKALTQMRTPDTATSHN